ncbi:MAG: MOSC domain-containing protein [Planctomycetales bacterium]|nr:MOSC domain-containing protein [Planctomycetales bacterium]
MAEISVISVNVGLPKAYAHRGQLVHSAIHKLPVTGPVHVGSLGFEQDTQVDLQHHGGTEQAVYAYFEVGYEHWNQSPWAPLPYGILGDNLTLSGLTEESLHIGDQLQIGSAILEASQPRQPCFKLNLVMNDTQFMKQFLNSRRLGCYFRVLREGQITTGDRVSIVHSAADSLTVADIIRLRFFADDASTDELAEAANLLALSPEWRSYFAERANATS